MRALGFLIFKGGEPIMKKRSKFKGSEMAIGIAVGIAIGLALDNIGLGIGIGIAIGIAFGLVSK